MCTNPENIRQELLRRNGRGDGSTTLIQDLSMQMTERTNFFNKITITSLIFIAALALAKQFVWAAFLFDLFKPLYFIYVCGVVVVDFLSPFLHTMENWYVMIYQKWFGSADSEEVSPGLSHSEPTNEDVILMQSPTPWNDILKSNRAYDQDNINNVDLVNPTPDHNQSKDGLLGRKSSKSVSSPSKIPIKAPGGRRHIRSRWRNGEAHPMILQALEAELRKEMQRNEK